MSDVVEIHDEDDGNQLDDLPIVHDDYIEDDGEKKVEPKEEEKKPDFDKEEYGKRVQKRIDKLTYEIKTRDDQINNLEKRMGDLLSRFEKEDQERQRKEADQQLNQLKNRKVELMETGDFDKVADIDDEIMALREKQRVPQQRQEQRQSQPEPRQTQSASVPEAQQDWLDANDWYYNPRKAAQASKANEIYNALLSEGYDMEDSDTYAELNNRLNKQVEKTTRPPAAPPPASVNRGSADTGGDKGKFTAQDKAKLRSWGLDPDDPAVRKEYLQNKGAQS